MAKKTRIRLSPKAQDAVATVMITGAARIGDNDGRERSR